MRAGALRHLLTIEQPVETKGAIGGQAVPTWSTFAQVYGSIEPLNGREFFQAGQMQSETVARARIRFLNGITTKMRVRHNGTAYNIVAVVNRELRDRDMELMLSEGLNDG